MDIGMALKAKQLWEKFQNNHPSFPAFVNDIKQTGIPVGTDLTVIITYPDGTKKKAGLHFTEADKEILEMLK